MIYKKHIFVCTNQRPEGARKCCGEETGMSIVREFKQQLKEKGLNGELRAQKAGCMDLCEHGPMIAIYPDGIFYGNVSKDKVSEIIERSVLKSEVIEELKIDSK
jgi:(2Fe-2S) ferredoxin